MSVWKASSFRDDALQATARFLPKTDVKCEYILSLCNFDVEEFGDFKVPPGLKQGNFRKQVEKGTVLLEDVLDCKFAKKLDSKGRLLKALGSSQFGLSGVYHLAANFEHLTKDCPELNDETKDFMRTLCSFNGAASYLAHSLMMKRVKNGFVNLAEFTNSCKILCREVFTLISAARNKSNVANQRIAEDKNEEFPEIEAKGIKFFKYYRAYAFSNLLILVHKVSERVFTLTKDDVTRFEKVILGLGQYHFYLSSYSIHDHTLDGKLKLRCATMLRLVFNAMRRCNQKNANTVCRAFSVAYDTYLSTNATDINNNSLDLQKTKFKEEKLDQHIDLDEYLSISNNMFLKECLEIYSIHKVFPQPDFDYFGAAFRQTELYKGYDYVGDNNDVKGLGSIHDIMIYMKMLMLKAFHKKHAVCPGYVKTQGLDEKWAQNYPRINPKDLKLADVKHIDFNGEFQYAFRDTDILDLVKDKACCPAAIVNAKSEWELSKTAGTDRNQLLDVFARKEPISLDKLRKNRSQGDYDVRAADKPEAKKPNGRWFFEAKTDARLLQSEYELAVSTYSKHVVGCMAGATLRDKIKRLNHITELPYAGSDTVPLILSFDIKAWSPRMPLLVHQELDKLWAEAFGVEDIKEASRIFSDGNIYYCKRKIKHVFPKKGRDFEGFAGRKLTLYHCAVMGYLVRQLREKGILERGGRFATLIDDGLVRFDVPVAQYKPIAEQIVKIGEQVYKLAGLYLSWDKTYISQHFAIFLNDIRYDGVSVSPGMRAFLKMTNRSDDLCPTVKSDLDMLESTARGAIFAGSSADQTFVYYSYLVADTIKKWGGKQHKLNAQSAIQCVTPVALGGLGIALQVHLASSTKFVGLSEGVAYLRAIAFRFRVLAQRMDLIVKQDMRTMSLLQKLRSPYSVRRVGRVLNLMRGRIALQRHLARFLTSPVLGPLMGIQNLVDTSQVLDICERSPFTHVSIMQLLWRSTTEYAIELISSKFLRSRTALHYMSHRALFRCFCANLTEAQCLLAETQQ